MLAVAAEQGGFFSDVPGGTGKTFLISLILAKIRSQQKIALAVASSGIAATLLDGGRTAHSTFKLPLDVHNKPDAMCNIKRIVE
ncbi:ATP-dependent DNA helicase [Trichonephila clavipes]|nr:ATP-dependent DNA helicase [Trichonephila clavipes]